MEECVERVMEEGNYSKQKDIAICKSQLIKNKKKEYAIREINKIRTNFIIYKMSTEQKTFYEADTDFDIELTKSNYLIDNARVDR